MLGLFELSWKSISFSNTGWKTSLLYIGLILPHLCCLASFSHSASWHDSRISKTSFPLLVLAFIFLMQVDFHSLDLDGAELGCLPMSNSTDVLPSRMTTGSWSLGRSSAGWNRCVHTQWGRHLMCPRTAPEAQGTSSNSTSAACYEWSLGDGAKWIPHLL